MKISFNKKPGALAILIIAAVLVVVALVLGGILLNYFMLYWKLLLSFGVIGGVAAGLIVYIIQNRKTFFVIE